MEFFLAGGFPMYFIVLFGAIALIHAGRFALQPRPGRLGPILAYGAAVGFAALAGMCVDLSVVGRRLATDTSVQGEDIVRFFLMGMSESMSPVILGFAILSVLGLMVAVGLRRAPPP